MANWFFCLRLMIVFSCITQKYQSNFPNLWYCTSWGRVLPNLNMWRGKWVSISTKIIVIERYLFSFFTDIYFWVIDFIFFSKQPSTKQYTLNKNRKIMKKLSDQTKAWHFDLSNKSMTFRLIKSKHDISTSVCKFSWWSSQWAAL